MSEVDKKSIAARKPRELKQPIIKADITIDFINKYFSYQKRLANYNYKIEASEENKIKVVEVKKEHKDWISFVEKTYDGTETKTKTKTIIKAFIDRYYPGLPNKTKKQPGFRGQFK